MSTPEHIIKSKQFIDDRGVLSVYDKVPFVPKRVFSITRVERGQVRGKHAHRTCHQFIVCVEGFFQVRLRLLHMKLRRILKMLPGEAVYVPPMSWVEMSDFSKWSACFVLASESYDPDDVISNRHEYNQLSEAYRQRLASENSVRESEADVGDDQDGSDDCSPASD